MVNVSHVVMYGAPESTEAIIQQIGRAGRDGLEAHAVLYTLKGAAHVDDTVREILKNKKDSCFRKALFTAYEENSKSLEPGHMCCTHCHKTCNCDMSGGCSVPLPRYEVVQSVGAPVQSRLVEPEDEHSIRSL